MPVSIVIAVLISAVYVVLMLYLYRGWCKPMPTHGKAACKDKVSVIMAVRNEAANLPKLLQALYCQSIEKDDYEIIVIDDNSSDNTPDIILEHQHNYPDVQLIYHRQSPGQQGKKAALQTALSMAKHPIIMQIDGDCIPSKEWIAIGRSYFADSEVQMVLGAVNISPYIKFKERFQALELLSLVGSGVGAMAQGRALMSNGSNLAFRQSVLAHLPEGFYQTGQASGDDMFLMMHVAKSFGPDAIVYVKDLLHVVVTPPEKSWQVLWQQRLRWVSKSGSYRDGFVLFVSFVVFFQNLLLLALLPLWLVWPVYGVWCLGVLVLKAFVDFVLLRDVAKFYKQHTLLKYYPLIFLVYPFFIVGTAIFGQFLHFDWKGRKY